MFSKSGDANQKVNFVGRIIWLDLISDYIILLIIPTSVKKTIKYDWEHPDFDPSQDKFMQRFDENGNFVNLPVVIPIENLQSMSITSSLPVQYELIQKKNELKP
jgi:hypothetical protein